MSMMGFCGLNCAACSNYKATVEYDFEELEREAKKWSDDKHKYSVTDMICLGCSRDNATFMFPYCKDCVVRKCAIAKGLQNCAECDEFLVCEKIQKFLASFSNDGIRKMMKLMHEKAMADRGEAAATKS